MLDLKNKRVIVTGIGIKPVGFVFNDFTTNEPTHTPVIVDKKEYKANLGTATALECARAGAIVHLVCHTEAKAKIVKQWLEEMVPNAVIEYSVVDLNDVEHLKKFVESLPTDLPLAWVQSLGLGAGTVVIEDDNPYLPVDKLSSDLIEAELSVLTSTISLLQLLLPTFRKQEETRICIVSSMSAIRGYPFGGMHAAAKGAISRFINAVRMELDTDGIFITDVRPGMVDTGGYDNEAVRDANVRIGKAAGQDWTEGLYMMPPTAVGEAIVMALASRSNILSINMVARGQELNEQS